MNSDLEFQKLSEQYANAVKEIKNSNEPDLKNNLEGLISLFEEEMKETTMKLTIDHYKVVVRYYNNYCLNKKEESRRRLEALKAELEKQEVQKKQADGSKKEVAFDINDPEIREYLAKLIINSNNVNRNGNSNSQKDTTMN